MNKTFRFFYIQILFIVYFIHIDYCQVYAGDLRKQRSKLNTLIGELYSMYKDAFENEKTYITRRFFTKDGHSHYTLHVEKLKEVDGVKTHNLRLEGRSKREDPIIYINNPVEAQMPNPFLSIDQFKKAMFERVEKEKKEFEVNRNRLINANKQRKVYKDLKKNPIQIFDVKKHVNQVVDYSNNNELTTKTSIDKLMKTILHNRSNKVNKERKKEIHARSTTESTILSDKLIETVPRKENKNRAHKVHVSHGTKFTRKPHKITIFTLLKTIADEEITTEPTADQKITTEWTADEDVTTETTTDRETNTETIADEKRTTEIPVDEEVTTETAPDEKNTTQTTVDHEITVKTTTDDGTTTESTADEDITIQKTADREINTETIADEKITTETPVDEEVTNETAPDEKNTIQTTVDHGITAETTADDGTTTETIAEEELNAEATAAEENNTEMIADEKISTEMNSKEEIITEIVTTTEPTVRTTRTKQLRPYVFMGAS